MTLFDNIGGVEWLDWRLHPDVVLLCVTLLGAYFYAINILRPRLSDAGRVKHSQVALYLCGVLAIFIATGTPIHDLSEQYLLSVHMVQHLLLTLVAPPLLIAGVPSWLWRAMLGGRHVPSVTRVLVPPRGTVGVVNLLVLGTPPPVVVGHAPPGH